MTRKLSRRAVVGGAVAIPMSAWLAACSSSNRAERSVPEPRAMLRTRWMADPLARGAGSYVPLNVDADERSALAAPLDSLFFAGEATATDGANTVAGAVISGRRVVSEVLSSELRDSPRVVVIGAGAAGLVAAFELTTAGITPVVLEGRSRIGGRVSTDDSLGTPVSLGAAAGVEPSTGAVLAPLAARLGLVLRNDTPAIALRDLHGRSRDASSVLDALGTALVAIASSVDSTRELAAALTSRLGHLDDREFAWANSRLELMLGAPTTGVDVGALADLGDLAAAVARPDPLGIVRPEGGLMSLLEPMAAGIDLRTDSLVTDVLWSRARNVVITSTGEVEFDALVITLPLGVLQAGTVRFDPPLPASKQAPIDRLGVGVVDKLVLQFDEVFWDDDTSVIGALGPTAGEWTHWHNLAPATGQPILVGHNAATNALRLGLRTDEQLVTSALTALRSLYG